MPSTTPTISIRLPEESRRNLDRATKLTRRSRSFLMKEALDRHLKDILKDETKATSPKGKLSHILMLGRASRTSPPRSKEEIDTHIRWLRDDD